MENNAANAVVRPSKSRCKCRSGSQHFGKAVTVPEGVQRGATGMTGGITEWPPCEGRLRSRLCFLSFGKR